MTASDLFRLIVASILVLLVAISLEIADLPSTATFAFGCGLYVAAWYVTLIGTIRG